MRNEWRCTKCGTLLGIVEGGGLILRYKDMEYVVTNGQTVAVCRKCRKSNIIRISGDQQKTA